MLLLRWPLLVMWFDAREVVNEIGPPTSMGDSDLGGDLGGLLDECCDILQSRNIFNSNSINLAFKEWLPQPRRGRSGASWLGHRLVRSVMGRRMWSLHVRVGSWTGRWSAGAKMVVIAVTANVWRRIATSLHVHLFADIWEITGNFPFINLK